MVHFWLGQLAFLAYDFVLCLQQPTFVAKVDLVLHYIDQKKFMFISYKKQRY